MAADPLLSDFQKVSGQTEPELVLNLTQYSHPTYQVDLGTRVINTIEIWPECAKNYTITKVIEANTGTEITAYASLFSVTSSGVFEILDLSVLITSYQIYFHVTNTHDILDSFVSGFHLVDTTIHYECAIDVISLDSLVYLNFTLYE